MTQFRIYEHPIGTKEAVKIGWSWPAFFLGFIWAYAKKMHFLATIVLTLLIIIVIASEYSRSGEAILNILSILSSIIFGVKGNEWFESSLKVRGYDFIDTVDAESKDGAIANYLRIQKKSLGKSEPF